MDNNTESFNQGYVDQLYSNYLAKRYGINSCGVAKDLTLLNGQKILSDRSNYINKSSPNPQDQIFMLNRNQATWAGYISSLPNPNSNSPCNHSSYVVPTAQNNTLNPQNVFAPIEVIIGSPQANILNILPDTLTIYNQSFFNQYVEIFRNNINLPSIDPGTGDGYFNKDFASYTINLSSNLKIGEIIKIKIIT